MTPHDLIAAFESLAEAPDGVERLRELILELAVSGKLVPQSSSDEPASTLVERIAAKRTRVGKGVRGSKHRVAEPISDDEQTVDIPPSWSWVRLLEVAHDVGQTIPDTRFTYIDVGSIDNRRGLVAEDLAVIEAAHAPSRARKLVKSGSVIFSTVRPYLRNIAIVDREYDPRAIASTAFAVLHPHDGVEGRLLFHWVRSPFFARYVTSQMKGVAYPAINDASLLRAPLPLPPQAEQHRIVARVDELMGLLDRLEVARTTREATRAAFRDSALAALREAATVEDVEVAWNRFAERMDDLVTDPADIAPLRQTVLELAVRGRLVPQDPSDEPADALLKRIAAEKAQKTHRGTSKRPALSAVSVAAEPFALPVGWAWSRLANVSIRIHYGYTASADMSQRTRRLLRITDIQNNRVDWSEVPGCKIDTQDFPKYALHDGDIVIARTGGTVGKTYRIEGLGDLQAVFASYLIRVVPACNISGRYLKHVLESPLYWEQLANKTTGTGQPNVSASALSVLFVPVPPLPEQERIVTEVAELMCVLDRLEEQLAASRATHAAFAAAAVHHLDP